MAEDFFTNMSFHVNFFIMLYFATTGGDGHRGGQCDTATAVPEDQLGLYSFGELVTTSDIVQN